MNELLAFVKSDPTTAGGVGAAIFLLLVLKIMRGGGQKFGPKHADKQLADMVAKGNYEAAAARELGAGRLQSAFDLYVRAQMPGRAAQVALRMGRLPEAADLYERSGDLQRAADLYRKIGQKSKAEDMEARLAESQKREPAPAKDASPDAKAKAETAREPEPEPQTPTAKAERAERTFRERLNRAAVLGEGGGEELRALGRQAAEAWTALGDMNRAAEVLADAGFGAEAVNLFANVVGNPARAGEVALKDNQFEQAAELFQAAGDKDKALLALVEWSHGAADPLSKVDEVARLGERALPRFCDIVQQRRPLNRANMELHYRMGVALQNKGFAKDAVTSFERLNALDTGFRDVAKRLKEVHKLAAAAAPPPAASTADAGFALEFPDEAPAAPPSLDFGALGGGDAALPDLGVPGDATRLPTLPPVAPGVAAGGAVSQSLAEMLKGGEIQKLVREAAQAAARQAFAAAAFEQAGMVASYGGRKVIMRGIEKEDLGLEFAGDSLVGRAKLGPSVDDIQGAIGGAPIGDKNVDEYYRLGLALVGVGRWGEAADAFQAVEKVSPGYRDAGQRAAEMEKWRGQVGNTVLNLQQAGGGAKRYTVLGELGRGGMAVVYRARDEALGREVALKYMADGIGDDPLALDMFQREARAVAQLAHPNIVTIYDAGVDDGRPYICMELVEGTTVADMLAQQGGPLPVLEAVRITDQLLAALEFAHSRNLIHRDIKPANLMRSKNGAVKVMDFGLAKEVEGSGKTTLIAGSPPYMAPEQFEGKGMDARTDLFAVGVSLYEMLTTKMPFQGIVRHEPPEPASTLNPNVPTILDQVIGRALEFEQEKRFASTTEMRAPLRGLLETAGTVGEAPASGATTLAPALDLAPPAAAPAMPELPARAATAVTKVPGDTAAPRSRAPRPGQYRYMKPSAPEELGSADAPPSSPPTPASLRKPSAPPLTTAPTMVAPKANAAPVVPPPAAPAPAPPAAAPAPPAEPAPPPPAVTAPPLDQPKGTIFNWGPPKR